MARLACALLLALAVVAPLPLAGAAPKPHIVFAMIDDWGHYNVGFRGNRLIKTPFIDSLVTQDSLLLTRAYTYKFCSPTRRSFLSGRQPTHSGQDNSAAATVDMRMHTIADKLSGAGYTTGQAGKWHAGHFVKAQTPHGRGFDTSLGYMNGACDHWKQTDNEDRCGTGHGGVTDLWDTDKPGAGLNGTYGDYLYVGRAVDVISKHDPNTPLFFYLAMQCAHDPMEVPQRFSDLYDPKTTPDVIEYAFSSVIDEGLKNLTDALKANNMWNNTLLVVSSDNGGPAFSDQHAASNYPLRGGKYTFFEGGLRVTSFVTGGFLPAPMRSRNLSVPIHVCDWYATFCGLAGVDPSDDHEGVPPIDSIDMWAAVSGQSTTPPRTEMFPGTGVLIQEPYKLIATDPGTAKWSGPLYPKVPATGPDTLDCKTGCLFNIVDDPTEHNDVAAQFPAILARMMARLDVLNKGVFEGKGPANVTDKDVCAATQRAGGYLVPSDYAA